MTDAPHTCPGYTCERPECVRRQRDELRVDAARYRWLRQNPIYMGWEHDFAPERIDRVIDGEMAEKEGK